MQRVRFTKTRSRTCNACAYRVENKLVRVDNCGAIPVTPARLDELCMMTLSNPASANDFDAPQPEPHRPAQPTAPKLIPTGKPVCGPRHLLGITCIFCADVTSRSRGFSLHEPNSGGADSRGHCKGDNHGQDLWSVRSPSVPASVRATAVRARCARIPTRFSQTRHARQRVE